MNLRAFRADTPLQALLVEQALLLAGQMEKTDGKERAPPSAR